MRAAKAPEPPADPGVRLAEDPPRSGDRALRGPSSPRAHRVPTETEEALPSLAPRRRHDRSPKRLSRTQRLAFSGER